MNKFDIGIFLWVFGVFISISLAALTRFFYEKLKNKKHKKSEKFAKEFIQANPPWNLYPPGFPDTNDVEYSDEDIEYIGPTSVLEFNPDNIISDGMITADKISGNAITHTHDEFNGDKSKEKKDIVNLKRKIQL